MPPSCFVAQIDISLAEKLKQDLVSQGFTLTHPANSLFSAQKKGVSCTFYTSGKLTVQGKEMDAFITYYLEPEILKATPFTYPEELVDLSARMGVDEAGKGDFFGPLCIGALYAEGEKIKELVKMGVRDSKQMSDEKVKQLSRKLKEHYPHSIVRLGPEKYNELYTSFRNVNTLLAWGHATALAELIEKTGCRKAVSDQFAAESVLISALKKKKIEGVELIQRHRAEEDPVVAGASILARAAFLEGLQRLSEAFGMDLPKGASERVITAGKMFVSKQGAQNLGKVAKLHFRTRDQVMGLL